MKYTKCDRDGMHVLRMSDEELHDLKVLVERSRPYSGAGFTFNVAKTSNEIEAIPCHVHPDMTDSARAYNHHAPGMEPELR